MIWSRAQVSKLWKQKRDETEEAKCERQPHPENLAPLCQFKLGQERHEKDWTTKPWRVTQRGVKERRGARSSSTVDLLAGRGMGARRRTLARILAVRRCSEERANTLERLIVGLQCCGSERAVAGTQGRRATVAWSTLAELLKILVFQSAEHSDRKANGFGYKKHTRRKSMASSPISQHFFVSLFAVVRAAC